MGSIDQPRLPTAPRLVTMPPVRCRGGAKAGSVPQGGRFLKEVWMSDFHYDASRAASGRSIQ
jgi:hypothetical protein